MGTYLVVHKGVIFNQEIRNTFYYVTDVGEPSDSEWQDIADEIRADFDGTIKPSVTTEYSLYGIDYRRVDSAGYITFSKTFTSGAIAGTGGGDPLPTQIALLVSNKGSTTKPNRARTYLAGFTDAGCVSSLWTAAPRNNSEAFVDLQSNLNGGGTNPLHRVAAQWNSSHTAVVATNDLSGAASVSTEIPATQRRRRIGVGI